MKKSINILPEKVINQIAAGEVIQRPASIVKELLENSIDAKANNIQLIVARSGKQEIKIIDDAIQAYGGAGVTTDPRLAQAYAGMRTLRLADGPDEVHRLTIARNELKKYL